MTHVLSSAGTATLCLALSAAAQGPDVTAWRMNLDGATGYSTEAYIHAVVSILPADVQQVGYDANSIWVRASAVPSHNVGPFPDGNPSVPSNVNTVHLITRNPTAATNPSATPLGSIGVMANGVTVYNAADARSYFNQGIWNNNAIFVEADGFDPALGHPSPLRGQSGNPPPGRYHYHQLPVAVLEQEGEVYGSQHSPLIGFAYDGYPIYGPYGYANANGTGGVKRMEPSWQPRNITTRTTLPNGTVLSSSQYGPPVSSVYPLGYYIEDYHQVTGSGDLDEHNGRFAVTPEYPSGTFAYYTTVDDQGNPAYPYIVGPTYYGVVVSQQGVTFPSGVSEYQPQVQHTGVGCGDFGLAASGTPTIPSASFALISSQGPSNGAVAYGFTVALLPIVLQVSGCPLFIDISGPTALVAATLDAQGAHTLGLPIPNVASLSGQAVHIQAVAAGTALESSNATTLQLR